MTKQYYLNRLAFILRNKNVMTYKDMNKALNFMMMNLRLGKLEVFDTLELIASVRSVRESIVNERIG